MSEQVNSDNYLDKMQIASVRLADTIYGFFSGNHPATTIDNSRAVGEVLLGIKNYLHKNKVINDTEMEFEDGNDTFLGEFRRKSNFTKHADRDTNQTAVMGEKSSYVALRVTIMDYRSLLDELMDKDMIVPDMADGGWSDTAYGEGNNTLILCNLYDMWDQRGFGLDIMEDHGDDLEAILNQTFGQGGKMNDDLADALTDMMLKIQSRRKDNSDLSVKRQWRDIADDLNLWPVPHTGGLKLARDKGIEFKQLAM